MVAQAPTSLSLSEEEILGGLQGSSEDQSNGTPHMWIVIGLFGIGLLLVWSLKKGK